ncbi:MAG: excisionase family DNA-binding protein [Acidimicrobiales bacterium]|nr:excisionase family DNA-binding protein [Acidimicrobiales bacterium]
MLDVVGLAARLGVTERFVRRLVHERRIPFYKVGSLVRFDVDSRRRRAVAGDASSRPDAPAPRSLTRFPSSTLQ